MIIKRLFVGSQVGRCIVRTFCTTRSRRLAVEKTDEKYVRVEEECGVRSIILDHKASHNSLSLRMLKELLESIKRNEDDRNLRSIVIKSASGKVFSAGHNLKELTADNESLHKEVFDTCSKLMDSIRQSPVPVIAAVNGLAAAAGCQLASGCDMVVCTERSTFSTPGANLGIFCSTPAIPLIRNISPKSAMYMLFTGRSITAAEALRVGLVSRVTPNDGLDAEVTQITSSISEKSRSVLHLGKKFLYEQMHCDIASAYVMGGQQMVKNIKMDDAQEGIKSFFEKRKPVWKHDY